MRENHTIKSLVQSFYNAIDAQHWDEQEAMVSADFRTHLGSLPHLPFKAWQQKLQQFYAGFPDGHHRLDIYTVEGDRILTVGHFLGTHLGTFQGHAPTGIKVAMKVIHLDRVIDGKIVEHTAQADFYDLLRQISAEEIGTAAPRPL